MPQPLGRAPSRARLPFGDVSDPLPPSGVPPHGQPPPPGGYDPPTPDGGAGVNSHHDSGFLTLLLQHGVGGLQALNPGGEWIDVPPVDGALVINLGETLQSMTGNYLVATTHRLEPSRPEPTCATVGTRREGVPITT